MRQLEDDLGELNQRLGFDPTKTWDILSIESLGGSVEDLAKFEFVQLRGALNFHSYPDRKSITWMWPLLVGEAEDPGATKQQGVLQLLHLPQKAELPTDLASLEFVDIHSQLVGRIGFELVRLSEFCDAWRSAAEKNQFIVAAGVGRAMVESAASLWQQTKDTAAGWTKCKTTSSELWQTSTGGKVDRARAEQAHQLRKKMYLSRHELMFHDLKKHPTLLEEITEWRSPEVHALLKSYGLEYRDQTHREPGSIVGTVRELSKAITVDGEGHVLMESYELLCNIVHPSMGGFRLYSSPELMDQTRMFSLVRFGRRRGRVRYSKAEVPDVDILTAFGHFTRAISQAAVVSAIITMRLIETLTAVADDIAITADVERLTLHKSWRYPTSTQNGLCGCLLGVQDQCNHEWGADGPGVPSGFEVALSSIQRPKYRIPKTINPS
jgi:hypothetical protein